MPGESKAFVSLGQDNLIQTVLKRLRNQVNTVLISAQEQTGALNSLGHTLVPDFRSSHRGPLMGLYSSLRYMTNSGLSDWLLLVPCDAPFLPLDLGRVLHARALAQDSLCATVRWQGYKQPTFSLWHRQLLEPLHEATVVERKGGLNQFLDQVDHEVVDWPEQHPPPFFNVNTADDLCRAQQWLDAG